MQAVLDVNHTYNYSGREPADWISGVSQLASWHPGESAGPELTLDQHPPEDARRTDMQRKSNAQAAPGVAQREELVSPLLSQFWGQPVKIRAWVILPPAYTEQTAARFPTVYWTHGFGGNLGYALYQGLSLHKRMKQGKMRPMIWVMLD